MEFISNINVFKISKFITFKCYQFGRVLEQIVIRFEFSHISDFLPSMIFKIQIREGFFITIFVGNSLLDVFCVWIFFYSRYLQNTPGFSYILKRICFSEIFSFSFWSKISLSSMSSHGEHSPELKCIISESSCSLSPTISMV